MEKFDGRTQSIFREFYEGKTKLPLQNEYPLLAFGGKGGVGVL